jgi:hypothetical protein
MLRVTSAMSTAMESKTEASTPTAFRKSQLRAICANTAMSTRPSRRLRPSSVCMMARPFQRPRPFAIARLRRPVPRPSVAATQTTGSHHGKPTGPTSVNEVSAARVASTDTIGSSAAIRAGTRGLSPGAERRRAAIRAATPSWLLSTLPAHPMLEAR